MTRIDRALLEKYTSPIRTEYEQLLNKRNNGHKMDFNGHNIVNAHVLIKDQNGIKSSSNTERENAPFIGNEKFIN